MELEHCVPYMPLTYSTYEEHGIKRPKFKYINLKITTLKLTYTQYTSSIGSCARESRESGSSADSVPSPYVYLKTDIYDLNFTKVIHLITGGVVYKSVSENYVRGICRPWFALFT